jgi:hypothetical protein
MAGLAFFIIKMELDYHLKPICAVSGEYHQINCHIWSSLLAETWTPFGLGAASGRSWFAGLHASSGSSRPQRHEFKWCKAAAARI